MATSKRLRFEVLKRDDFTCRYCGTKSTEKPLTIDHVVPEALGGSTEPSNLVAACADCNAGKSSTSPTDAVVEDVAQDALRWARAMKQAAEWQAEQEGKLRVYLNTFDFAWEQENTYNMSQPRPDGWRDSLRSFYEAGLELDAVKGAVRSAMTNPRVSGSEKFRYFCGICWSILRERREIAEALLAKDEADGENG